MIEARASGRKEGFAMQDDSRIGSNPRGYAGSKSKGRSYRAPKRQRAPLMPPRSQSRNVPATLLSSRSKLEQIKSAE